MCIECEAVSARTCAADKLLLAAENLWTGHGRLLRAAFRPDFDLPKDMTAIVVELDRIAGL